MVTIAGSVGVEVAVGSMPGFVGQLNPEDQAGLVLDGVGQLNPEDQVLYSSISTLR